MNPTMKATSNKKKLKLVLTRPRTTVSIAEDIFNASTSSAVSTPRNENNNDSNSNEEDLPTPRSSKSSKSSKSTKSQHSTTPSLRGKNNNKQIQQQKDEIENQRKIQKELKAKFEVLEQNAKIAIQSKDKEIDELKQTNTALVK